MVLIFAGPEDSGSDTDYRSPIFYGETPVFRHAYGQLLKVFQVREFGSEIGLEAGNPREVRPYDVFVVGVRRHAHESAETDSGVAGGRRKNGPYLSLVESVLRLLGSQMQFQKDVDSAAVGLGPAVDGVKKMD